MKDIIEKKTNKGEWYAVRVHMGFEEQVCRTIQQTIDSLGLKDTIFQVIVPTEKQVKIKGGKRREHRERIFPGFILINMFLEDKARQAVCGIEHVTGFAGSRSHAEPLSHEEIETIFGRMSESSVTYNKSDIEMGDTVKITDGPFADLDGQVSELDPERGQITVLIPMFGRETPVRLDLVQVRRIT